MTEPTERGVSRGRHHDTVGERRTTEPRPIVPPLARDVHAMADAIEKASPEALSEWERRMVLRLQTAAKAEQSAELTLMEGRAKKLRHISVGLGTALGVVAVAFSTAWSVYHDARGVAIDVADTAKVEANAAKVEAKKATEVVLDTKVDTASLESRFATSNAIQARNSAGIADLKVETEHLSQAIERLTILLDDADIRPAVRPKRRTP